MTPTETRELTDGLRVFRLTGEINKHGMSRAEVVRLSDAGRRAGWQAGVMIWLTPDHVTALSAPFGDRLVETQRRAR